MGYSLNKIIDKHCRAVSANKKPTVLFIGGQMGAGKSTIINEVCKNYEHKYVSCNIDDLREFVDERIVETASIENYHELTYPQAATFCEALIEHCKRNKFNMVIEKTYSSPDYIINLANQLKDIGYSVEMHLMAVHRDVSLIGTKVRFEEMLINPFVAFPRIVKDEDHDDVYNAIPDTVKAILDAGCFDKFAVYERNMSRDDNDLFVGTTKITEENSMIVKSLKDSREKEFTIKTIKYMKDTTAKVYDYMLKRNAERETLAKLKSNFFKYI